MTWAISLNHLQLCTTALAPLSACSASPRAPRAVSSAATARSRRQAHAEMSVQSGISVGAALADAWRDAQADSSLRALRISIESEALVVSETLARQSSDADDFGLLAVEPTQPVYFVYRLLDSEAAPAWLLVVYTPDIAPVKAKMLCVAHAPARLTLQLRLHACDAVEAARRAVRRRPVRPRTRRHHAGRVPRASGAQVSESADDGARAGARGHPPGRGRHGGGHDRAARCDGRGHQRRARVVGRGEGRCSCARG